MPLYLCQMPLLRCSCALSCALPLLVAVVDGTKSYGSTAFTICGSANARHSLEPRAISHARATNRYSSDDRYPQLLLQRKLRIQLVYISWPEIHTATVVLYPTTSERTIEFEWLEWLADYWSEQAMISLFLSHVSRNAVSARKDCHGLAFQHYSLGGL